MESEELRHLKTGQRICRLDEAIRAAEENSDCHYEAKSCSRYALSIKNPFSRAF